MTRRPEPELDSRTAAESRAEALRLAFAPFLFQAVCALREFGILEYVWTNRRNGVTRSEVANHARVSPYAATVLLEAGLAARVFSLDADTFFPTRTAYYLLGDEMTRVNIDFVRDICYRPLQHLVASLREGSPRGLPELGDGFARSESLYADFDRLPADAARSWLAFDHYYSSLTYDVVLAEVLKGATRRVLDVGANDGRFAAACLGQNADVQVTLVDHAVQIAVARERLVQAGLSDRATFVVADLADDPELPEGFDAVWASQVLDCLSEPQIARLLSKVRASLEPGGRLMVLEPCWDLQPQRAGQDALALLSLYFACAANGNSRMYDSATLVRLLLAAGFEAFHRQRDLAG
jgi:SAM-dependent methyltransferase